MLAVLLAAAARGALQAAVGTVFPYAYHQQYFLDVLGSDMVFFSIPILGSLPAATALVDDVTSRYIVLYLPRTGRKKYIQAKLAASVLSGGGALLLGTLVFYLIAALVYLPMEAALASGEAPSTHLRELCGACGLVFLNGAFCSLLGMTLSSLTQSRYMAYASPFVVYYLLIIVHERFFRGVFVLYPREWLFPRHCTVLNGFAVPLVLLEAMALIGIVFYLHCRRRFEDG